MCVCGPVCVCVCVGGGGGGRGGGGGGGPGLFSGRWLLGSRAVTDDFWFLARALPPTRLGGSFPVLTSTHLVTNRWHNTEFGVDEGVHNGDKADKKGQD